eukprot:2346208-Amphidinium_carterae.1
MPSPRSSEMRPQISGWGFWLALGAWSVAHRLVATQQHNNRPVWKKLSKPERLLFFSQADKACGWLVHLH